MKKNQTNLKNPYVRLFLCLGAAWTAAGAYWFMTPNVYQAKVNLVVSDNQMPNTFFTFRVSSGYEAILRYTRVLQSILDSDPSFLRHLADKVGSDAGLRDVVKRRLASRTLPGSLLLEVSFTGATAEKAKFLLDSAITALGETLTDQNRALVESMLPRIDKEISLLKQERRVASDTGAEKARSAEEAVRLLELKKRELDTLTRNFTPPYVALRPSEADTSPVWPRADVLFGLGTLLGLLAYVFWYQADEIFG